MGRLSLEIIFDMKPWFKFGKCKENDRRTPEQKAWDSAILCVAEYVRRRMNYDEKLSLEICGLLSDKLPD
jgi:hypothetical protein